MLYDTGVDFSSRNNFANLGSFATVSVPVGSIIPWSLSSKTRNCATLVRKDNFDLVVLLTYNNIVIFYFQEQCAWAIGNIAVDSEECRDILISQNVISPLIALLKVLSL